MRFDKLKPDLSKLNPENLKRTVSKISRVRFRPTRRQWIAVACGTAAVVALLVFLLRPRPAAVELPVVEVEPVETEDVNIYGDYVGRKINTARSEKVNVLMEERDGRDEVVLESADA